MQKCLILFIVLSFWFSVDAQTSNEFDSLYNRLPKSYDSLRVRGLTKLFEQSYLIDPNRAKRLALEGLKIAQALNHKKLIATCYLDLGRSSYYQSTPDTAIAYSKKALIIFQELNDAQNIAKCLNNIGGYYYEIGKYVESLEYLMKGLKIRERYGDDRQLASSYGNIGNVHADMDNARLALHYYKKALEHARNIDHKAVISLNVFNIGTIYSDSGQYASAIPYYKESLAISRSLGQDVPMSETLNALAKCYIRLSKLDSAHSYLMESYRLCKKTGNTYLMSWCYLNMADYSKQKKQYDSAIYYMMKRIELSKEQEALDDLTSDYFTISKIYEERGDIKKSLAYYKLYNELEDSIYTIERARVVQELEINYQTEKKEKEIAIQHLEIETLEQAAMAEQFRKRWLIAGLVVALALAGLIYYSQRQRLRRQRVESEQERLLIENELTIKKKELTSHTLHLVQKNDLLDDLNGKLKELKKAGSIEKGEITRLIQIIKNDKVADKDWENFKLYFDQVHEGFDAKLREHFQDLTPNEIRLVTLMKMKLSTKEIASILNISPDSVNKARYRLRKKLNMNTDDRLEDFILAL